MIQARFLPHKFFSRAASENVRGHLYRIAAKSVASDVAVAELEPFKIAGIGSNAQRYSSPPSGIWNKVVAKETGWIGGQWRSVESRAGATGYRITIAGIGTLIINSDGSLITYAETQRRAQSNFVIEAMLGPGLTLALALQCTHCLHASAIEVSGQAVAFLGESGNGKSTLAAFLDENGERNCRRAADDILPVTIIRTEAVAMPHFPQLKLRPDHQFPQDKPEALPLKAIYLLHPPNDRQADVDIQPVAAREAMLALVRHTVAARLFDKSLLARHLDFCASVTARVPVRRLSYPRRFARLPDVFEALKSDLRLLDVEAVADFSKATAI